MTDGDRRRRTRVASSPRSGARGDGVGRSWFFKDDGLADSSADLGSDLVSLGFISAALRRSRRLRAGLAILGVLIGAAFWFTRPPTPQASTTLLLEVGAEGLAGTAILNEQAIAESRGVAQIAARKLRSHETADGLLGTYKADVVTDRILRITAAAPSSSQAVTRANAIASAFLEFRTAELRTQENLQFAALDAALAQSQQHIKSLNSRIFKTAQQATSGSQRAQLRNLQGQRDQATSELNVLTQQVEATKATTRATVAAMVGKSEVLVAANPLPQSHLKPLVLFSGAGLVLGLFLGAAIVIVRALVTDRLRRRDDVALALGAPVSVSIPEGPRRLPGTRHGSRGPRDAATNRIVSFLRGILPPDSRSALAVIPVDDVRTAAQSVVSLAATLAKHGSRVVVADLCEGAPAANLVGLKNPGLHTTQVEGAQIDVAIPEPDDIAPIGPLRPTTAHGQSPFTGEVAAHYAATDVLLTLTTLDPSLASDHLATWATDAVVVVTAGRSSWTKIHAIGELIRLAGTRLISAVLVGADKWDETLGVIVAPAGRESTPASANGNSESRSSTGAPVPRFVGR